MYNTSAKPIWMQNPDVVKADKSKTSPSLDSFRASVIHDANKGTQEMKSRTSVSGINHIRRYPNGSVDMHDLLAQLIQAVRKMESTGIVTELEGALLTLVLPDKARVMDPSLAKIRAQLSPSELANLKALFVAKMKEIDQWSGGQGGGSLEGRTRTWA